MSNREGSLQEVQSSAFWSQMNGIHTAIPCIVVAVRENLAGAMVDIQPTINQKFKDGTVRERPTILGVPVSFPMSSTAGVVFPIKVGTTGTAIFSMRSIEAWKSSQGTTSTPPNFSKFDKADAIFYPGIQPPGVNLSNPNKHIWEHSTDDIVVFNNIGTGTENEIRLQPSGNIIVNTNQDVEVNCNNANVTAQTNIDMSCTNFSLDAQTISITASTANVSISNTTWNGNISQSGNYTGVGVQTFNGIVFSDHVHGGVMTGPSVTLIPQ